MRAAGPEKSIVPRAEAPQFALAVPRPGGRVAGNQRQVYINTGVVSQARGSAYIEFGGTKIMAACYGPRDMLRGREYSAKGRLGCDFRYAPFACRHRRSYVQDDEEREFGAAVEQALQAAVVLERYPKASIDVYVTVLEDDGGVLGGAMTCASAAVAAAGIEMRDLVAGCSLAWAGDTIYMDPCGVEEQAADVVATTAYMASLGEVCSLLQDGELPFAQQADVLRAGVAGCNNVYVAQQHALRTAAGKTLERLQREAAAAATAAAEKP